MNFSDSDKRKYFYNEIHKKLYSNRTIHLFCICMPLLISIVNVFLLNYDSFDFKSNEGIRTFFSYFYQCILICMIFFGFHFLSISIKINNNEQIAHNVRCLRNLETDKKYIHNLDQKIEDIICYEY